VELPRAVASLVDDLRDRGFSVVDEQSFPTRASGLLELAADRAGVSGVRLDQDRGLWGVEVRIGSDWYDPYTALRALNDLAHDRRAQSHEERRAATVALVEQLRGEPDEVTKIKARHQQLIEAHTRWATGAG
jgi:hypothetical protein